MHSGYSDGVLIHDSHNGGHSVATQCREGLEVGLQSGSSAWVAPGYREATAIALHIFQPSPLYALSQNIHSIRVQVT